MKEIAGNLRRDVKDLLEESASIVTGFFKNGLCTVRGAADRWRNFTHNISGTFVSLFKSIREATLPEMPPDQEPMVTVMESGDWHLPVGTRMTLSKAEERIKTLNQNYRAFDEPKHPVKVAIDYMLDGKVDRYWLPLHTGSDCGSMLEQMQDFVKTNLDHPENVTQLFEDAPAGLRELLHEQFGPQFHDDMEMLATRVISFFQQHNTITRLEKQFQAQAEAMPEKEKEKFLAYTKAAITDLRKAANTSKTIAPVQERTASVQAHTAPVQERIPPGREDGKSRQSVKAKLGKIREGQAAKTPQRQRNRPQRQR